MFDFIIPKSRKKPERLIQIAPYPNKNKIKDLMFRWKDTQEIRGTDVKSYTILNNQENPIAASFIEALQAYESTPIPWSERDEFAEELAS
jgi:hypothetical protein